jgi:hypothetical protein
MKTDKNKELKEEQKFPRGERVHYFFGQISVSGEDGKTWYLVNAKNLNSDDFDRMLNEKPVKIPMLINSNNLEEWRMSPRMDSTLVDWRKQKGKR